MKARLLKSLCSILLVCCLPLVVMAATEGNAILLYDDTKARVMELESVQIKENALTFKVKLLSKQARIAAKMIGPLQLVIDGYDPTTHTCTYPCQYLVIGAHCVCGSQTHHM